MDYKVYKMDDYSWVATPWDLDKTTEWYQQEYADLDAEDIQNIQEADITKECIWDEVSIGDTIVDEVKMANQSKPTVGEYRVLGGSVCRYITLQDALMRHVPLDNPQPFIIASTEW
jgi:hypothetical protein